jgi:hypothetical protein
MKSKPEQERIYRAGIGDPRQGAERIAGAINRVASGNRKAPVRQYDDTLMQMARNRKAPK